MATPLNVKDVLVKFNGKVLGCVKSAGFKITQETESSSCQGSGGWNEFTFGFKGWTGSLNGVYREFTQAEIATNVAFDDILDVILDGSQMVDLEYSQISGGSRYTGKAILSEVSYDQPEKGALTWSANLTGSGAFQRLNATGATSLTESGE